MIRHILDRVLSGHPLGMTVHDLNANDAETEGHDNFNFCAHGLAGGGF